MARPAQPNSRARDPSISCPESIPAPISRRSNPAKCSSKDMHGSACPAGVVDPSRPSGGVVEKLLQVPVKVNDALPLVGDLVLFVPHAEELARQQPFHAPRHHAA